MYIPVSPSVGEESEKVPPVEEEEDNGKLSAFIIRRGGGWSVESDC